MNVYDFDGTIYRGDSSVDLYKWLVFRHPKMLLKMPKILMSVVAYLLKLKTKTQMKESIYSAFQYVTNMENEVKLFWQKNYTNIYPYYLKQQKEDDIIISASPLFSIKEACTLLNIKHYYASLVDINSGKYEGLNCHGKEKVKVFNKYYKGQSIDEFYSDSHSDSPLAQIAKKAYLVSKGHLSEWGGEK